MKRHFEVAIEQITQAVYRIWAEDPEEAEEIATRKAMGRVAPDRVLYSDVTSCCADEVDGAGPAKSPESNPQS